MSVEVGTGLRGLVDYKDLTGGPHLISNGKDHLAHLSGLVAQ